jgi:regulator of sirC expression with transglutaminase-like and TPR domain
MTRVLDSSDCHETATHGGAEVVPCTVVGVEHTSRWRELLSRKEEDIPLDEAALLIAAHADPALDVRAQLDRLDSLSAQLGHADVDAVCVLVFETLGVRGDVRTYDDPRNSYLDQVLDRRLGIPISISVLLMEIGRRCGVPLVGVGMPGHFLVRDPARPDLLIDAFSGGTRLDRAGCARLLRSVAGAPVDLPEEMLAPVGTRAILARMLANLDHSFRRRGNTQSVRWATRLRAAIPGQSLAEQVALADGLAALGCYDDAAALLEESALGPGIPDEAARSLRNRAQGLRARFN